MNTKEKIQKQIIRETYIRNFEASVTFCALGLFCFLYNINSDRENASLFSILGVAIFVANLGRLVMSKLYTYGRLLKPEKKFLLLRGLIQTNALLFGSCFLLAFHTYPVFSEPGVAAILILVGVTAGATSSLPTLPLEQSLFFLFNMVASNFYLSWQYAVEGKVDNFSVSLLILSALGYFLLQARKIRHLMLDSHLDRIRLEEEQENLQRTLFVLKKTQDDLLIERAKNIQSERLAAIGALASGIAHEINNPLAISNGQIFKIQKVVKQIEAEKGFSLQIQPLLEKMTQVNFRISEIIQGLRTFASEDDEKEVQSSVVLGDLVEGALLFLREKIKNSGVELLVEEVPLVHLYLQKNRVTQSLFQLMKNAFEAVEKSETKIIRLRFENSEKEIRVILEDSGPGISDRIRDRIFDPFFTTKDVGQGTGLGLSMARGILTGQGGELELLKNCPVTTFVATLPKKEREEKSSLPLKKTS